MKEATGRKNYTPEQIIGKCRESEVLLDKGESTPSACRAIGCGTRYCAGLPDGNTEFSLGGPANSPRR